MGRRYPVTGGAGFIGSNFIRRVLEHEPDATVTNLAMVDAMPPSAYRDYLERFVTDADPAS